MAKSPAARSSVGALWPLLAVVAVALFMVWLATSSEPAAVAVPEEMPEDAEAGGSGAGIVVQPAEFEGSEASYWGQDIQLEDVAVAQVIGPQLVLVELPSGAPFVVALDSLLVASGAQVQAQTRVTVVGRVLEKTDSVLTIWQESGALTSAADRQQAEPGGSYIEARRIQPSGQ
jgi:hypothetical protein